MELKINVNGEPQTLYVEPRRLLVEVLREDLGLVGTKEGCASGMCGACTVLIDGRAVKSCLLLALQANGREVTTIEGLAPGEKLHPLQESFIEHGAIQCGFCTPGMILMAKSFLAENPSPDEEEIKAAMSGNLCRCTGYVKIVEAVKSASASHQLG